MHIMLTSHTSQVAYVLTTAGRKNYGKMSPALVKQYESLLHGSVPKHYRKEKDPLANFEKLANVFASIVKVEVSAMPGGIAPCKANPFDLFCPCKGARKTGICSHILVVTHIMVRDGDEADRKPIYNLKYMMSDIGERRGRGRGKGAGNCMQCSSSDEEPEVDWD